LRSKFLIFLKLAKRSQYHCFVLIPVGRASNDLNGSMETTGLDTTEFDDELKSIVASLPPAPFSFAYGSAVFPQVTACDIRNGS
jgi:hypothetical protein